MKIKKFSESASQSKLDREQRDLLSRKICDLALKIPGTRLEEVNQ